MGGHAAPTAKCVRVLPWRKQKTLIRSIIYYIVVFCMCARVRTVLCAVPRGGGRHQHSQRTCAHNDCNAYRFFAYYPLHRGEHKTRARGISSGDNVAPFLRACSCVYWRAKPFLVWRAHAKSSANRSAPNMPMPHYYCTNTLPFCPFSIHAQSSVIRMICVCECVCLWMVFNRHKQFYDVYISSIHTHTQTHDAYKYVHTATEQHTYAHITRTSRPNV